MFGILRQPISHFAMQAIAFRLRNRTVHEKVANCYITHHANTNGRMTAPLRMTS
jgi:hypothetical protein